MPSVGKVFHAEILDCLFTGYMLIKEALKMGFYLNF